MKVRVTFTEDISDEFRRGINLYYDKPGMASREEVKSWLWLYGVSMNDDLMMLVDDEYNAAQEED